MENYKRIRDEQTRKKVEERKKGRMKERMRGKNERPKIIKLTMLLKPLNNAIDDRQ